MKVLYVNTLYERDDLGGLTQKLRPIANSVFATWKAVELVPGAPVRVTIRNGVAVRVETSQKPDEKQFMSGVRTSWFRDAVNSDSHPDFWLYRAVSNTDFSSCPDGEWEGEAVGPGIRQNRLRLEESRVVVTELFPYAEANNIDSKLLPPELGRTPVEYEDVKFWLSTSTSMLEGAAPGSPLDGAMWWWIDTPVAQVRIRDFMARPGYLESQ